MQLTYTEENYLKAIYTLQQSNPTNDVSVNEISERMQIKPATVTDMLRKLSEKQLIYYEKYRRIQLAPMGHALALQIIRKHRLWETFLFDKLRFSWNEVHEVAEQLEHIQSQKLIDRLDELLGHPRFDPHGEPIPDPTGAFAAPTTAPLSQGQVSSHYRLVSYLQQEPLFLEHMQRLHLNLGATFSVSDRLPFDQSMVLELTNGSFVTVSEAIASLLVVVTLRDGKTTSV